MNDMKPAEPESAVLTPPANPAKLARLRRVARDTKRLYRFKPLLWAALLVLTALLPLISSGWTGPAGILPAFYVLAALYLFFGMPRALAKDWRKNVSQSGLTEDIQAIGVLIEGYGVKHERLFVMETLTRLLPRLKSSDAQVLSPRHHSELNRLLNYKIIMENDAERAFACAIFKAYEQVGGPQDLPTVQRLANGAGYAKRNEEVREAARECLPYLQARSDAQDLRENLLRASPESADNSAILLRSAAASSEAAPHELLRPVDSSLPQTPPSSEIRAEQ